MHINLSIKLMIKNFEKYLYQDNFNDISSILIEEVNANLNENLGSEILSKVDVSTIIKLIHLNGNDPFIKQEDICKVLSISKKDLLFYNSILKKSSKLQELLTDIGVASKFLKNTIFPVIQSGSLDAYNNKKNFFPFKIGLFPGLSCMFECTFCGRNYDAVYDRSRLDKGMEMYKKLIKEAPKNDSHRFYIAGGLEPLTNPRIGELIDGLASDGFRSSMYTNAYMLTEKFLNKNKQLFNLDYLRISIYGTDKEDYLQTTKHVKGYEQVFSNIPKYLKLKDEIGSKTKFGMNYIILKKYTEKLEILVNKIIEINKEVGLEKNNFDFLTLREDFSVHSDKYDENDKLYLSKVLQKIEKETVTNKYLKNLYIDYGFALDGIKKGYTKKSLADSFVTENEFYNSLGVPHSSVVVDLYGDVYMFREAGFLDRPGSKRYIIGNLIKDGSMENIMNNFNNGKFSVDAKVEDIDYMDAWDHVVIKLANQYKSDIKFGIPFELGPMSDKVKKKETLSHKIHYSE